MFKRIDHLEIVPTNLGRSIKFCAEVLDFNIEKSKTLLARAALIVRIKKAEYAYND